MANQLFDLTAYQYDLPSELIAQHPCLERDQSRLMLINRQTGDISEIKFHQLLDFLQPQDQLIFNNTRVIPARLFGTRTQGGKTEIFLIKQISVDTWEVMARPGKKLKEGTIITFSSDFYCQVMQSLPSGHKIVRFTWTGSFEDQLNQYGHLPLPHYIQKGKEQIEDRERYQTRFASEPGAVAAPTAGLHFSDALLEQLKLKGISQQFLTLHVGLGTFKPVQTADIREHLMHEETYDISQNTAHQLNHHSKTYRQICVGTTCCRALESAANSQGVIQQGTGQTNIFIYPGYSFKFVKSLLTNFHLPGSSLLMLVSAFGGYELIKEAYQKAIKERFRFYSYGDAMLIF